MYDKTKGVWRTINGAKVFIVNGLSVEESIKLREIEDAKNESLTELEEKLAHSIDEASDKVPITPITEEAIQKVGVISIPGYTENECAFIAEQHKELLRYARDNNDNEEVAFVFRKDLSDRKIITGGDKIIDLGSSLSGKGDDLVILHNHPRNGSFSKTDIDEYFNNAVIKTISIVKNNGYVEIITKLSAISSKDLFITKERYQRKLAPHKTDAEYKKMIPKLLAHLERKGGIIWKK